MKKQRDFSYVLMLVVLWFLSVSYAWAQTGNRYALVIGNADYKSIRKLNNTINDAEDIAAALDSLGYNVDIKRNLSHLQMVSAIEDYVTKLASNKNSEGFFWYAGHAVQRYNENYLLPVDVDVDVDTEYRIRTSSYSLNSLIKKLEKAKNKVNILILDSCREDPLPKDDTHIVNESSVGGQTSGSSRGLFRIRDVDVPADLFIMFSTAPGEEADDGDKGKRNSPFAEAFLKHIKKQEPVMMVAVDITNETMSITGGRQRPYMSGSIISEKYYSLNRAAVVMPPVPDPLIRPEIIPANMVRIQGGTFAMGSPANEAQRNAGRENPQHQVTVSSFYIGKYQVTQKEYQEVMGKNPGKFKGDNLPVECVSWYDAVEYCNALSLKEGLMPAYTIDKRRSDTDNKNDSDTVRWLVTWNKNADGYRLPTEAEWEYACRAGTTTPFYTGNNITTGNANYNGNNPYNNNSKGESRQKTISVGSFMPNSWGLYDMHGNVCEWCWDWYGSYKNGTQTDPEGTGSGTDRVIRGGSWSSNGQNLRSAYRNFIAPSYRFDDVGFRVVR